jgi:hypothetical protein
MEKKRIITSLLLVILITLVGCDTTSGPSSSLQASPFTRVNADEALTGQLNLRLEFGDLRSGELTIVGTPANVQNFRFALAQADMTEFLGPAQLTLPQLSGNNGLTASFPSIPLGTPLMLRVQALDAQGTRIYDSEQRVLVREDGETIAVLLTPVEAVRSAVFYQLPALAVTNGAAALLASDEEKLTEAGAILRDNLVLSTPSPCSGWTLEVGGRVFTLGPGGRVRLLASDLTEPTGILRHATDADFRSEVDLSLMGRGQTTGAAFYLAFHYLGGCGMNQGSSDEFCGVPVPPPPVPPANRMVRFLAQALVPILPPSLTSSTRCEQLIPAPTQIQILDRGHYPQPKIYFIDGTVGLAASNSECEQTNGFVEEGDVVRADSRPSSGFYFFGSTCFRFVAAGCCPNENATADLVNLPAAILQFHLEGFRSVRSTFFGDLSVNILDPALVPRDTKSCIDNHGGRQCQEVQIGDVSLDFQVADKGPIVFPNSRELTVMVEPDEEVDFVLHNNGCFGVSHITATEDELGGTLLRTHREYAISPPINEPATNSVPKLQTCTDPLFGATPTAGANQRISAPPQLDITPSEGLIFGAGDPVVISHTEVDPSVAADTGLFARYRYFPDISLQYRAPSDGVDGDIDRFVFCVDDCEVAVRFELEDPDSQVAALVDPSRFSFQNGLLDQCPQSIGTFRVRNGSEEPVNFEVRVPQDANTRVGDGPNTFSVDRESGQLPANGQIEIALFYNCTIPSPFQRSFPVEIYRVGDGTLIERQDIVVEGEIANLTGDWEGTYNYNEAIGSCNFRHSGNLSFRAIQSNGSFSDQGTGIIPIGLLGGVEVHDSLDPSCPAVGTTEIDIMRVRALYDRENSRLTGAFHPRRNISGFQPTSQVDPLNWVATTSNDGNTLTGEFSGGAGTWTATRVSEADPPILRSR